MMRFWLVTRRTLCFAIGCATVMINGCVVESKDFCDSNHACADPSQPFCDMQGDYATSNYTANTCIATPQVVDETPRYQFSNGVSEVIYDKQTQGDILEDIVIDGPYPLIVDTDLGRFSFMGENVPVSSTIVDQEEGPSIRVFYANSFTLHTSIAFSGRPAVAFAALEDIDIDGGIHLVPSRPDSSGAEKPGNSYNDQCSGLSTFLLDISPSGAGGGTNGASGTAQNGALPQAGGLASGTPQLVPLRGGCTGGRWYSLVLVGQDPPPERAAGGRGGGALQLSSGTKIILSPSTVINAGGGGGQSKNNAASGGSGGGILLEAPEIVLPTEDGGIAANGGGGGCDGGLGQSGKLEGPAIGVFAAGTGGTKDNSPTPGLGVCGAGGAVGRIRFNSLEPVLVPAGMPLSPDPTYGILLTYE